MGRIFQPNATGIDKNIQTFQSAMYNSMKALWKLADTDWNCYDRAYRNQSDGDAFYPEVFIGNSVAVGKGKEYREVLVNDMVSLQSFFLLGENIKYQGVTATAQVSAIFMITNLDKLKPNQTSNRPDEAVRLDVQRFCSRPRSGFTMTEFILGIDNVFKEYNGWGKKTGLRFRDMYPMHCFRINFSVTYNIQDC